METFSAMVMTLIKNVNDIKNYIIDSVWDEKEGKFLGRTGTSWAKIGGFYGIFYACLGAFFAITLAIFYQTLDTENRPTYSPVDGGSLLQYPSLGFRPRPRPEDVLSTLIWYKNSDKEDIKHWVNELNNFTKDYEGTTDDGQNIRECSFAQYEKEMEEWRNQGTKRDERACEFQILQMEMQQECHKNENWGFNRESPCILLKPNRLLGWEPDVYTNITELPERMPFTLKEHIIEETNRNNGSMPPMVWLSCEGENPADKEFLSDVVLKPFSGFPAYYFPYRKNAAYRSPLVAVQFIRPTSNVVIFIECRMWAKNIIHDRKNLLGLVHFELIRD